MGFEFIFITNVYILNMNNNYKPKVTNLVKLQMFLEKIENKEKIEENGK
jgi:hypothetical protein